MERLRLLCKFSTIQANSLKSKQATGKRRNYYSCIFIKLQRTTPCQVQRFFLSLCYSIIYLNTNFSESFLNPVNLNKYFADIRDGNQSHAFTVGIADVHSMQAIFIEYVHDFSKSGILFNTNKVTLQISLFIAAGYTHTHQTHTKHTPNPPHITSQPHHTMHPHTEQSMAAKGMIHGICV